jgi:hypothetical protein
MILAMLDRWRLSLNKGTLNYWVDVATGLAGVISAASGLVFPLPGDITTGILGISYQTWNSMHTWSSLALLAGVGAHLVLHWKWMVSMTGRILSPGRTERPAEQIAEPAYAEATGSAVSRRAFLALGGVAALATGLVIAGRRAISNSGTAEAAQSSGLSTGTWSGRSVACPRGLVKDRYPGQCRHYVDADGDGICDYSVAGSGASVPLSGGGAGGFPGRPGGFGQP